MFERSADAVRELRSNAHADDGQGIEAETAETQRQPRPAPREATLVCPLAVEDLHFAEAAVEHENLLARLARRLNRQQPPLWRAVGGNRQGDLDVARRMQDVKVAGYAHERGRAAVIAVNKWDLIERKG